MTRFPTSPSPRKTRSTEQLADELEAMAKVFFRQDKNREDGPNRDLIHFSANIARAMRKRDRYKVWKLVDLYVKEKGLQISQGTLNEIMQWLREKTEERMETMREVFEAVRASRSGRRAMHAELQDMFSDGEDYENDV